MPTYSIELMQALKDSTLVETPEFLWNEIEVVAPQVPQPSSTWRKPTEPRKPAPPPKAAIPFSQRSLFDVKAREEQNTQEEEEEGELDDDEYAAKFLLKNKRKNKKNADTQDQDGAQVINLSYAAALAATMKMSEAQPEEEQAQPEEPLEEDGWVSVSSQKPRRNRQNNFSRW